jgi:hypothetical protein
MGRTNVLASTARAFAIVGLVAIAWLMVPAYAAAQIKVAVVDAADDMVGGRLVYAVKEGIRRSSGLVLADRVPDALIQVKIVTLDPDDNKGIRTIYSVVWTAQTLNETPVDMYLTNNVGLCGTSRVPECADRLVAQTDVHATRVRGWILDVIEKVKTKR